MEDVGIFVAIRSIFSLFGTFYGALVYFVVIWYIFSPFWHVVPRKNLATPGHTGTMP
jgi:hypothetical protein